MIPRDALRILGSCKKGTQESAGISRIGTGNEESYNEDLANHFGLKLYADSGNVMGVDTTDVHAGKLWCSEITHIECRRCLCSGMQ